MTDRGTIPRSSYCVWVPLVCCFAAPKNSHMKHSLLLSAALLGGGLATAQTEVTIPTGAANANQVFYSLSNGVETTAALAEWDLAFEITGLTSSILVNTGKGLAAWKTNVAFDDWSSLTAFNEAGWVSLENSTTDWSAGALNHGSDLDEGGMYMGWGGYNPVTHFVTGDKIYVIATGTNTYKKLRVDHLISGTYTITYADIDGQNEQTGTLVKSAYAGKNFGYFSFETGTALDREPISANWDLLFTKYRDYAPTIYGVAGVLSNKAVTVLQVDGVDPALATWWGGAFSSDINTIGYDWKSLNSSFQYVYPSDRTYFVQDRSGSIWKLIFTQYGGSGSGTMTFTQELLSSTSVVENTYNELVVFPNPSTNGQLNIVLGQQVRNGQLTILDQAGRLVKQQLVNGAGELSTVPVDLNGVDAGVYLIRLEAAGTMYTSRVVVE